MAAGGVATRAIARAVGCTIGMAPKWRVRYAKDPSGRLFRGRSARAIAGRARVRRSPHNAPPSSSLCKTPSILGGVSSLAPSVPRGGAAVARLPETTAICLSRGSCGGSDEGLLRIEPDSRMWAPWTAGVGAFCRKAYGRFLPLFARTAGRSGKAAKGRCTHSGRRRHDRYGSAFPCAFGGLLTDSRRLHRTVTIPHDHDGPGRGINSAALHRCDTMIRP
jgi:hypothetical protein